jgi:organic hydroperoxide reductase OsmC/OhrA
LNERDVNNSGMSEHQVRTVWKRGERPFRYEAYARDHETFFAGGASMTLSAAEAYRGDPRLPNPEDLLVAALSSCHMLSFLAIAAKRGLVVDAYDDDAVGTLAPLRDDADGEGRLAITRCVLRPSVRFDGVVERTLLDALHAEAHHACFIASSVKTDVTVEPRS